jgi:uncharacterized protein with PIN domain
MKFVVDGMLGKLAKWLRILGFDVVFLNRSSDAELLRRARREKRILLTRDHPLLASAKNIRSLFIASEDWPEQLAQVLDAFKLRPAIKPYSRCLACNVSLRSLPRRKARNLVAPFIYEHACSFAVCPSCGRVFWPGTHYRDMDSKIEHIVQKKRTSKDTPKAKPGMPVE